MSRMSSALKSFISVFLAVVIATVPIFGLNIDKAYAADTPNATITVSSVGAEAGQVVDVELLLANNPGILCAGISINYDSRLTIVDSRNGDAWDNDAGLSMTKPGVYAPNCKFIWDGVELEKTKNGTVLVLTFKIPDDAELGTEYAVEASYKYGDITDEDFNDINVDMIAGSISVDDYRPGDVNNDGEINPKDVVFARRHIAGGYIQDIKVNAIDVDGDGAFLTKDIVFLRRYIAGGYGVVLKRHSGDGDDDVSPSACEHSLNKISRVEPQCEIAGNIEYWECSKCSKLFMDAGATHEITETDTVINATGHTVATDPAVEPTTTQTGLTEGSHCSVCHKVLVEQKIVPVIADNEYTINYNIANGDSYLASLNIENPNSSGYNSEDGLELQDLEVAGYRFNGWFNGATSSAQKVTEIPKGSTGSKKLYAHWEKIEYQLLFDSNVCPIEAKTFTVDTGATLENPTWYGYTFVCWTDEHGNVVSKINKGTAENITLHANWTSKRYQTRPAAYADEPLVIDEDLDNGIYSFVYEIGTIENVPLNVIQNFPNMVKGVKYSETVKSSKQISEETGQAITEAVAQETTRTDSWTLSEELSREYEFSETHSNEVSQEQVDKSRTSYSETGKWSMGSGWGTSSQVTTENGVTGRVYAENKLDIGMEAGVNAGLNIPLSGGAAAQLGASSKYHINDTLTVGGELTSSHKETKSTESNFNLNSSYESGRSFTQDKESEYRLGQKICDTTGYKNTLGQTQSQSSTQTTANTSKNSRECASTLTYATTADEGTERTISFENAQEGYYRLVTAGKLHVFAVVTYDAKTNSYSMQSYSILDDKVDTFFDYSASTNSFDDNQNGVLPFEMPKYVDDYIKQVKGTDKMTVDPDSGLITRYYGDEKNIIIPEFVSIDNDDDTRTAVKITGIKANAFAGKDIEAIELNRFITEIPAGAFKGCEALSYIACPSVTTIGDEAFAGCKALDKFTLSTQITSIGNNAFSDVKSIKCYAANSEIAKYALTSGASSITLDVSKITDELKNYTIEMPDTTDYFAFIGGGKTFSGVSFKSEAKETVINNAKFVDCMGVPFDISSESFTLNRVTAESSGLTLILKAITTELKLYATNNLNTLGGDDTVLCRNVNISQSNSTVAARINLKGNVVTCGNISEADEYFDFVKPSEVKHISEEEFEKRLQSSTIYFDANGGSVTPSSLTVSYGNKLGTLPIPTREGFTFDGWFTSRTGGNQISEDTVDNGLGNITVFAHWTSDWVKKSDVPEGKSVTDTKYTYDLTSYTTSDKATLSGWTQYKSDYTWSSYGAWSGWSDSKATESESRKVETRSVTDQIYYKTVYNYFRWASSSDSGTSSPTRWGSYINKYTYQSDSPLGVTGNTCNGYTEYKYWHGSHYWIVFSEGTSQVETGRTYKTQYRYCDRSKIYTYYYKKIDQKESVKDPSGQENVSNVVEWVKYKD